MQQRLPSLLAPPITFAHRGARANAPDNTIEAFQLALDLGAGGLESDVWLTRDGVPVLDHDGTDQQRRQLQRQHRHDRDGRVAQTVCDQRAVRAEALGARGAQVVLAHDVQDGRSHVASHYCALDQPERERRQDQAANELDRVFLRHCPSARGQPTELHCHDRHEQDAGQEARHRHPDLCRTGQEHAAELAVPDGGQDAERQSHYERNEHAGEHEPRGDL